MNETKKFKLGDFLQGADFVGGEVASCYGITPERAKEIKDLISAQQEKTGHLYKCGSPNTIIHAYKDVELESPRELAFLVHYLLNSAFAHYIDDHLMADAMKKMVELLRDTALGKGMQILSSKDLSPEMRAEVERMMAVVKSGKEQQKHAVPFHFGKPGEA